MRLSFRVCLIFSSVIHFNVQHLELLLHIHVYEDVMPCFILRNNSIVARGQLNISDLVIYC